MAENKTLLLVGDLIHDINLIENPPVQTPHFSELPETREIGTPGGVAFLYHILQKCLSSQNYCYSNRSTPVCGFFCSEDTGHKSFSNMETVR